VLPQFGLFWQFSKNVLAVPIKRSFSFRESQIIAGFFRFSTFDSNAHATGCSGNHSTGMLVISSIKVSRLHFDDLV
jgi:hypothetical protein